MRHTPKWNTLCLQGMSSGICCYFGYLYYALPLTLTIIIDYEKKLIDGNCGDSGCGFITRERIVHEERMHLFTASLSRCSSRCTCRPWVATQTLFLLSWYFPFFLAALVFSAFWYELIPCCSLPSAFSGMYYCFQGQKDSLLVASKVSTREYSMCISKKKRVLLGKKELEPDYLTLDKSYFVLMLDWTLFIRL